MADFSFRNDKFNYTGMANYTSVLERVKETLMQYNPFGATYTDMLPLYRGDALWKVCVLKEGLLAKYMAKYM